MKMSSRSRLRKIIILSFTLIFSCKCHFQQYFSYKKHIYRGVAVSFTGGGILCTQRKPQTYRKSQTNYITKSCIECTSRFELITFVVIGTDSTGS
jgi:hypothetical protein